MRVIDLIRALEKMPHELEVYTEGCDCFGDVDRVGLEYDGNEVDTVPHIPDLKRHTVTLYRS